MGGGGVLGRLWMWNDFNRRTQSTPTQHPLTHLLNGLLIDGGSTLSVNPHTPNTLSITYLPNGLLGDGGKDSAAQLLQGRGRRARHAVAEEEGEGHRGANGGQGLGAGGEDLVGGSGWGGVGVYVVGGGWFLEWEYTAWIPATIGSIGLYGR